MVDRCAKTLLVSADGAFEEILLDEPLWSSLQKAVGGFFEVVHPRLLAAPYCMVVDEEGLLKGLPVNKAGSCLCGHPVVGGIAFMREGRNADGEPDLLGLTDDDMIELRVYIASFLSL